MSNDCIFWSYEKSSKDCTLYNPLQFVYDHPAPGFISGPKCCSKEYKTKSKYCPSTNTQSTTTIKVGSKFFDIIMIYLIYSTMNWYISLCMIQFLMSKEWMKEFEYLKKSEFCFHPLQLLWVQLQLNRRKMNVNVVDFPIHTIKLQEEYGMVFQMTSIEILGWHTSEFNL